MRRTILFSLLAVGGAPPGVASPQTGSGGSASSSSSSSSRARVSTRTRCASCDREAERLRNKLLIRIDSLRWEFDHARMNQAERERLSEEMTRAVMALQETMEQQLQLHATAMAAAAGSEAAVAAAEAMRAPVAFGFAYTRPSGYIGVTFDAPTIEISRNGEHVVRFYQYPRIVLVEPDSPADRGGVLEGDTLLSLNGDDVKTREISFTKLLVPDNKIVLRVRREGDAKELKVVVGVAPDYYASRMTPVPRTPGVVVAPMAPIGPMEGRVRVRTPAPPESPYMPYMSGGSVWIMNEGVAGAKVETLSEDLGKAFGAKTGVLILKVTPGSPASRAGLRDGDVVLRAGGEQVTSVRDLRLVLQEADREEGVRLLILRERKQKDVTLRW